MAQLAYLGLGIMGTGMVRNLLAADHDVVTWNRTRRDLPADLSRASAAGSIAEAVADRGIVFLCLTGPDAQRAVYRGDETVGGGLLDAVRPGMLVVDCTTTDPLLTRELGAAVAERGGRYVDAPVFGSRNEAWTGVLDFVCGGAEHDFAEARPYFEIMGKTVHHMGDVGAGAAMKLVGNLLVATQIAATGEALGLARKSGLSTEALMGVLKVTDYSSGVVVGTAGATLESDFRPHFYLKHMLKDARLIEDYAGAVGVPLLAAGPIGELYQAALNAGLGDLNASALHRFQLGLAGEKV